MEDNQAFLSIKNRLSSAQSIIIILPPDPGKDLLDSGLSLHLSLQASGKQSRISCSSEIHSVPGIEGLSEITDSIGSRNLVISFDYREEDLDKVDYDVRDDGRFYLLVKPKENSPVPDVNSVKYSYTGAAADLVLTLGVNSLEELGKIYADEKSFLDSAEIISLNTSLAPTTFTANYYHQPASSFSELVAGLIEKLDLKLTSASANNLLQNIYAATANLTSPQITADTFSAIAGLLRFGAVVPSSVPQQFTFSQPPFFEVPQPQPQSQPLAISLPPAPDTQPIPADWNGPKIFRVNKQ